MPQAFLKAIDEAAKDSLISRSAFVRLALLQKMGWQNLHHGPEAPQPAKRQADSELDEFNRLLDEL
jgi:hypothetical protein